MMFMAMARDLQGEPDKSRYAVQFYTQIANTRERRLPSGSNMRGISRYFSATSNAVFKFCSGLSFDNLW